jgi:raffinose/stachyose/melibiose transport system substrate-binding protein
VKYLRYIILMLIIAASAWALWPPTKLADRSPLRARESRNVNAKYVLRVAPQLYLPGSKPQNVGKPLVGLNIVADEFEKLFPDTRIEFANVPSGQREWLVTQLSAGQAPDIFNVNVEDVWQDVQKGWYVPLDRWLEQPNPFVKPGEPGSRQWWDQFKYQHISRGKAAPDGNMYCISYDMVETGIFYNKNLFRKYGFTEPTDWDQFTAIEQKLKDEGYTPLLINDEQLADWGVDLLFDQLYYSLHELTDLKTDPKRAAYLTNYLDWDELCFLHTKGFFTEDDPRWVELWRLLKQWRKYMPADMRSADMTRQFMTQKGAMCWNGSWMVNKLVRDPDMEFEWGVFYVPRLTKNASCFASGVDQCVIGGSAIQLSVSNSAIGDTSADLPMDQRIEKSERLKRCIAFLQFMCLPHNADTVINEVEQFLPNIVGVEPHKELLPFDTFLKRRYTSTKWVYTFDLRFQDIMNRMLSLYLNDGIDEKSFVHWMTTNVTTATRNIQTRKQIDLSEFDRIWESRKHLRETLPDLPHAAR